MTDTIYALSSAVGRAGVAVVRASGPHAIAGLSALSGITVESYESRRASVRTLRDPQKHQILDHAMILVFRGPASFTGEDVVEYHLHGGPAVVQGIIQALSRLDGHRMAQPGEFTRRAFENGKLDLTAAEAVADLIHAETESQRQQALLQMDGALYRLYEGWKERIAHLLALMEADLDFSDQDLPEDLVIKVRPDLSDIRAAIAGHLDDSHRGEILRDGFRIVIIGPPNAGKSSLLNALARRDAAIVSPIAGTTRDMIDVHLNLGGYAVILTDTAGLRTTESHAEDGHSHIEAEGIRRALARSKDAHLKIFLYDGTQPMDTSFAGMIDNNTLCVANKMDVAGFSAADTRHIRISAQDGTQIDQLLSVILSRIQQHLALVTDGDNPEEYQPSLTRARHREALSYAQEHIDRSMVAPLPELAAEDLRLALRALGSLTGRVDIEDLLDMIFRDFCIGK